ncbi:hypothetical protein PGB90_000375 [Kerria lacca]
MKDDNLKLVDSDIIQLVKESANDEENYEEVTNSSTPITHTEGFEALQKYLKYIENQSRISLADVTLFRKWRDFTTRRRIANITQEPIEHFYKK